MRELCDNMPRVDLKTIFRTSDEKLLSFLSIVRKIQPVKELLAEFFAGRHLSGSLQEAVRFGLSLAERLGQIFTWLCVTNKGADKVNRAALAILGMSKADLAKGYPGDPKVDSAAIVARPGLCLRLTRNIDKERTTLLLRVTTTATTNTTTTALQRPILHFKYFYYYCYV